MQPDPALLEVDIVNVDQPYFRSPQTMPIGKEEDRVIAGGIDDPEQSAQFILSKELDSIRAPRSASWFRFPGRSLEL